MKKITDKAVKEFGAHLVEEEKSRATLEKYVRDVSAFSRWLGKRELCKAIVLEYKELLIEKFAPASVNSALSSLNSFFEYIGEYGLKVKSLKIQKRIFADRERELTKAEYNRLLKAAKDKGNERLFLLMQTICASGLRVSEIKFITIEAVKARCAEIKCKGKIREVFLPDSLCRELLKYAKKTGIKSGMIFVTRNGRPLDRTNIWSDMKKLCLIAEVSAKKVFPHNLRHLFARTFYMIEKDIVHLSDILGHSSVNTTRIYTMETGERHRKQIQKLGLVMLT